MTHLFRLEERPFYVEYIADTFCNNINKSVENGIKIRNNQT